MPSGFAPSEPWPSETGGVELRRVQSAEVLLEVQAHGGRAFALDPYSGCQFACTHCPARQQSPFAEADFRLFERDIHGRANAAQALSRALEAGALDAPLWLGQRCDPWQPLEKSALITRAALEVLARAGGVDLRARTRSSLVARDADLFRAVAARGKASVTFSIGTLDPRLARLLEPLAPTPDRRLVAMEALARAGVRVGVAVGPLLSGLNDSEGALEALLERAGRSGASFATCEPLAMPYPARRKLVRFVSHFDPERATRYDRLFARAADCEPGCAERMRERFAFVCEKVGLPLGSECPPFAAPSGGAPSSSPRQLSLFPPSAGSRAA